MDDALCPECGSLLRPLPKRPGNRGARIPEGTHRYCPLCVPTRLFGPGLILHPALTPIEYRTACGAALLDTVRPDWARAVDRYRLNMAGEDGVLEQLWGSFHAGFRAAIKNLRSDVLWSASAFGFTLFDWEQTGVDVVTLLDRFGQLTRAWQAEVERRLNL